MYNFGFSTTFQKTHGRKYKIYTFCHKFFGDFSFDQNNYYLWGVFMCFVCLLSLNKIALSLNSVKISLGSSSQ